MLVRSLLLGVCVLSVAAGCWLVYIPAGLIAFGLGAGAVGLFVDDGKPSK